ncbi:type I restriction-modification enzyme, S subunit [Helicobacter pylori Hp A-4]|uniref:restriction endonuclease subunit S n=1 Tax=Helicobacter pylori TaxID=210 RepID=UPI00026A07C2|nr:restriction endonuclease subunit S [Helicobacter pylori]EJB43626.1 type I restriction-modification enzyme, S subunit [Helicobacter pylori Hp A-4]
MTKLLDLKNHSVIAINQNNYTKKDNYKKVCYLDTDNITNNRINAFLKIDLTKEKLPSRAKRKCLLNSIIYSSVRPNQRHFGIIKEIPKNFLVSTAFIVIDIIDLKKLDPNYLYYYITQDKITHHLQRIAECGTSSYPSITPLDFLNVKIKLYPLATQQKIARTLSVLDQKIENNHKINELLHKILELLYEQYFIRFDFLDENNKPYQTSGGKMKFSKELNRLIPNDFEVKTLGELVDIFSGYSFQSNTYSNNKNDYILITNKNVQHSLIDLSITTNLLFLPKKLPKYCLLEPTNILITLTGHIGRCALVFSKNCILNQRVGVVLPKEKELNPFYYSLIRNPLFSAILQKNAIGSSQQNLSPIDTLKIQIPFNHKIIKQYSKTCENIIKLLVSNMQSTQTLTALRDFLLPLLLKQQVKPQ